jgi:hypothetical protein
VGSALPGRFPQVRARSERPGEQLSTVVAADEPDRDRHRVHERSRRLFADQAIDRRESSDLIRPDRVAELERAAS